MFSRFVALKTKRSFSQNRNTLRETKASRFSFVVVLESYLSVSRQGCVMRPGGTGAQAGHPASDTPSLQALTPPSAQLHEGLGGWRLFPGPHQHRSSLRRTGGGQQYTLVAEHWPWGSRTLPPVCESVRNKRSLFWFVPSFASSPVRTIPQLRPQVTDCPLCHSGLPWPAQGEGAPRAVTSCGHKSRWRPVTRGARTGAEAGLPGGPSPAVSLVRHMSPGSQASLLWLQPCVTRGFFLGPRGAGSILCHVCDR